MTGFAAAVVEAWQELRIHKLRVLLSLVGVAVAVCALTTAVAVGSIAQQALTEQSDRQDGRPATFGMYPYNESGRTPPASETRLAFAETMRDFDITYYSIVGDSQATAMMAGEEREVMMRIVDPPYADMRRIVPVAGRWLEPRDAENYSPAIVVNAGFLKKLGLSPDALPATVTLKGDRDITATIVGQVRNDNNFGRSPMAFMLADAYDRWFGANRPLADASYQMWVPLKGSKALGQAVERDLRAQLPGTQIDVGRQDYLAYGGGDPLKEFRYALGGISALILLLGAMSLLNIALVTIKQRVREIGIRRSFGATTGRVFFSVMMESVVATFVAGLVGVIGAVAIVNSPLIGNVISVTDIPPFPISAAVVGLLVSLGVGAVAGILPAIFAVRVAIIDAIRF